MFAHRIYIKQYVFCERMRVSHVCLLYYIITLPKNTHRHTWSNLFVFGCILHTSTNINNTLSLLLVFVFTIYTRTVGVCFTDHWLCFGIRRRQCNRLLSSSRLCICMMCTERRTTDVWCYRHEVPVTSQPITIVHMDEDIVVVNKPASIPVSGDETAID